MASHVLDRRKLNFAGFIEEFLHRLGQPTHQSIQRICYCVTGDFAELVKRSSATGAMSNCMRRPMEGSRFSRRHEL